MGNDHEAVAVAQRSGQPVPALLMRRSLSAAGLPAVMLVVVVIWALGAVGLLTGTLINAEGIDQQVGVITRRVSRIDRDVEAVRLAARTDRLARRIFAQARPLAGELGTVVDHTSSIDRRASSILGHAQRITGEVLGIHGTVGRLLATVDSIHAHVGSIHGTVGALGGEVRSIDSRAHSIRRHVGSIRAGAASIHRRFAGILRVADRIDSGVRAINLRALTAIAVVRPIFANLTSVLAQLGPPGREHGTSRDATIGGHVHSVDCRLNAGTPPYC